MNGPELTDEEIVRAAMATFQRYRPLGVPFASHLAAWRMARLDRRRAS